jgi:hypothetical protein
VVAGAAPVISSFTPPVATVGTNVTVIGTNFDATPANDRLKVNATFATVTAATTTSLTTAVAVATSSGPLTVVTARGSAISATDLFIPPGPYTAADVVFTDRVVVGGAKVVTINAASHIGLVTFAVAAGHRVSLTTSSTTIPFGKVTLLGQYGTTLGSSLFWNDGTYFIEAQPLSATGTYSVMVEALSGTGSTTLTLYDVVDVLGTMVAGGSSQTVTTTMPGQNAALTFAGAAGQRISLLGTNGTYGGFVGCGNLPITILNPDTSVLASNTCMGDGGFIDVQTLPTTGTYTVQLNPAGAATGSITLTLYTVPADTTGTISVNGSSSPVTLATPGQNATLTFAGTASQQVTVHVTSNTMSWVTIKLLSTDGVTVLATGDSFANSFDLSTVTAPSTGAYTVRIDPDGADTGSLNIGVTSP